MSQIENGVIIADLYVWLARQGLQQNREKFMLPDAGHRGWSADVGSSYGEVAVRIIDSGVPEQVIRITKYEHVAEAKELIEASIRRKRKLIVEAAKSLYSSKNGSSDRRPPR